jgi:hypothetical protein
LEERDEEKGIDRGMFQGGTGVSSSTNELGEYMTVVATSTVVDRQSKKHQWVRAVIVLILILITAGFIMDTMDRSTKGCSTTNDISSFDYGEFMFAPTTAATAIIPPSNAPTVAPQPSIIANSLP